MRVPIAFLALVALATVPAPGQDLTRVFHFADTPAPQARQEIVNIVRAIGEIQSAAVDNSAGILTVSGTSGQIAMAEWLFYNLDRSADAAPPAPSALQFTVAGAANDVARIFYLTHAPNPRIVQEAINTVRSIVEIQRAAASTPAKAIVIRGTNEQMAAAQWLIPLLDKGPGQGSGVQEFTLAGIPTRMGATPNAARVFYLQHTQTPQAIQEMVNLLRSITEIQRVVANNSPDAITLRGTSGQAALAAWFVQQLDKPAAAANAKTTELAYPTVPEPYEPPEVRLFYPSHVDSPQALIEVVDMLRTTTKMQRAVAFLPANALAVRGTGDQIARAEQILKERDNP